MAGDTKGAIEARRRLLARGVGQQILAAVATRAGANLPAGAVVVDLGCGSGELLARVCTAGDCAGVGIDLSVSAIEIAARQFAAHTWVVANADRRLPLLDRTVDCIVSLHGRRNPAECARALTAEGRLVVAVPGAGDLEEVRAAIQGQAVERDRGEVLRAEHAGHFTLVDRVERREQHRLGPDALRDLLRGTYRGARHRSAERLLSLETMEVTLASDAFVFARRIE